VRLCDSVDYRETETGAAFATRAGNVTSGETLEDPVECVRRDTRPAVHHLDDETEVEHMRAEFDRVGGLGVLDGILEQSVDRVAQRLLVCAHLPVGKTAEAPNPGRHLRPADKDLFEECLGIDLNGREQLRLTRFGEEKQARDDPVHPAEFLSPL
jgi:hypothetical protein